VYVECGKGSTPTFSSIVGWFRCFIICFKICCHFRNPNEREIVIEPFLVPPIKQQRISDERELTSEHKAVDAADGGNATKSTTSVDGTSGVVGALGKMRRRNAMEYATKQEDSDREDVK
jgi:hypothetical protein